MEISDVGNMIFLEADRSVEKKLSMKYLPDFGTLTLREMLDKIVLDILHGDVSKTTIETAIKLYDDVDVDIEDYDFIHFIAGGNPA